MTQYYAPVRDEDDQILMMAFFDDLTEEQQKQIITVLRKHNQKDVLRAWGETDCSPEEIEQQRDATRRELNTARKEIDRLRGMFSTASKERDAATRERDKLRVDLQTTLNERNAARNELRIMSGELSVITATRDAWKRRCDEHRVAYRELKELADRQTAQLHAAKQTETTLRDELNDARQQLLKQATTIEQLRADFTDASQELWGTRIDHEKELEQLVVKLQRQIDESNQIKTTLREALNQLSKERDDARQRVWQQVVTIEQLRKEVDLHQRANADLRKENDALAAMMPVSYEHDSEPTALSMSVSMAEMMKQAISKELEPGGLIHSYAIASAAK